VAFRTAPRRDVRDQRPSRHRSCPDDVRSLLFVTDTPDGKPDAITVESMCETTNAMPMGCSQMCNDITDSIEVGSCGAGGACEIKNVMPCAPWARDPQSLLCKTGPCKTNQDCAAGNFCDLVSGECGQL
jgi:hypothetical protein